jgi:hypothetical protein
MRRGTRPEKPHVSSRLRQAGDASYSSEENLDRMVTLGPIGAAPYRE